MQYDGQTIASGFWKRVAVGRIEDHYVLKMISIQDRNALVGDQFFDARKPLFLDAANAQAFQEGS